MNNNDNSLNNNNSIIIYNETLTPLINLLKSKNHIFPLSFETLLLNEQSKYITEHLTQIFSQYENLLKYLESKERLFYHSLFTQKCHLKYLQTQVGSLLEMQDEYEQMKEKYRYEEGIFLHNDRKDNEIIILRKENTNLKKHINHIEQEIQSNQKQINELELTIQNQKTIINQKQQEINRLVSSNNNNITSPGTLNSTAESQMNSLSNNGYETKRNLHFHKNTFDILSQLTKYSINPLYGNIHTLKFNNHSNTLTNKHAKEIIHCNSTSNIMVPRLKSNDNKKGGHIRIFSHRKMKQLQKKSPLMKLNKVLLPVK